MPLLPRPVLCGRHRATSVQLNSCQRTELSRECPLLLAPCLPRLSDSLYFYVACLCRLCVCACARVCAPLGENWTQTVGTLSCEWVQLEWTWMLAKVLVESSCSPASLGSTRLAACSRRRNGRCTAATQALRSTMRSCNKLALRTLLCRSVDRCMRTALCRQCNCKTKMSLIRIVALLALCDVWMSVASVVYGMCWCVAQDVSSVVTCFAIPLSKISLITVGRVPG